MVKAPRAEAAQEEAVEHFLKFLGLADDSETRAIVEAEVRAMVSGGVDEEGVAAAERRVTSVLRARRRSPTKQQPVVADEWALLDRYAAVTAKQETDRRAENKRQQQQAGVAQARVQVALAAQRKKQEEAQRRAELQAVEASVKAWRQAEVDKRSAQRAAALQARSERRAQVEEELRRRELTRVLRRAAETHAAAAAAAAARDAAEKERAARERVRLELQTLLAGNEAAQQRRAQARRLEAEQDLRFMQQHTAILDGQEAQRKELLARMQAVQEAQAVTAASRPSFKRWIDPELIERQAMAAEAKASEEAARRKAAALALQLRVKDAVAVQLKEHEAGRKAAAGAKALDRQAAAAAARQATSQQQAAVERRAADVRRFKADLDRQIQEEAAARSQAGMNATERKLNAELLRRANALCTAIHAH